MGSGATEEEWISAGHCHSSKMGEEGRNEQRHGAGTRIRGGARALRTGACKGNERGQSANEAGTNSGVASPMGGSLACGSSVTLDRRRGTKRKIVTVGLVLGLLLHSGGVSGAVSERAVGAATWLQRAFAPSAQRPLLKSSGSPPGSQHRSTLSGQGNTGGAESSGWSMWLRRAIAPSTASAGRAKTVSAAGHPASASGTGTSDQLGRSQQRFAFCNNVWTDIGASSKGEAAITSLQNRGQGCEAARPPSRHGPFGLHMQENRDFATPASPARPSVPGPQQHSVPVEHSWLPPMLRGLVGRRTALAAARGGARTGTLLDEKAESNLMVGSQEWVEQEMSKDGSSFSKSGLPGWLAVEKVGKLIGGPGSSLGMKAAGQWAFTLQEKLVDVVGEELSRLKTLSAAKALDPRNVPAAVAETVDASVSGLIEGVEAKLKPLLQGEIRGLLRSLDLEFLAIGPFPASKTTPKGERPSCMVMGLDGEARLLEYGKAIPELLLRQVAGEELFEKPVAVSLNTDDDGNLFLTPPAVGGGPTVPLASDVMWMRQMAAYSNPDSTVASANDSDSATEPEAPVTVAAVTLPVNKNGDLLVTQRAFRGMYDGMWVFPGGHVDGGEALLDAAQREVREETGIKVDHSTLKPLAVWEGTVTSKHRQFCVVFFTAEVKNSQCRLQTKEVHRAAWVPKDLIPRIMDTHTQHDTEIDGFIVEDNRQVKTKVKLADLQKGLGSGHKFALRSYLASQEEPSELHSGVGGTGSIMGPTVSGTELPSLRANQIPVTSPASLSQSFR